MNKIFTIGLFLLVFSAPVPAFGMMTYAKPSSKTKMEAKIAKIRSSSDASKQGRRMTFDTIRHFENEKNERKLIEPNYQPYSLTNTAFDMDHMLSEIRTDFAKRAEQRETPTRTIVPMCGAKHRFNNPEATASAIETSGLKGCIATATVIKYQNGCSGSIITHYPPTNHIEHDCALEKQIKLCNEKAQSPVVSSHVEIVVPGNYQQDTNKVWRLRAQEDTENIINLLEATHKVIQGNNATSSVTPYSLDTISNLVLHHPNNVFTLYRNKSDMCQINIIR